MTQTSKFLIEHQCPQCGAPATLEETDHLFACEFCRVKSYLLPVDFFRYMLPHNAPKEKPLIFLPYWRFKGCLFSCVTGGIRQRIADVSHQASVSAHFPATLGLRSQTQKLRFVTPDTEGRFLKPTLPYREVLAIIEKGFSASLPKPIFAQSFIGETVSQIYAPFYIEDRIYDAILNRPVSIDLPGDFEESTLQDEQPAWPIRFVPTLCPNCGWDMEGERDSLALSCRNCNSLWLAGKKGFRKLGFAHIPEGDGKALYLPFDRIKAGITGIALESYADLVKIANLPRVIQEDWTARPFHFWSPAFKVRPQDFLRFSRNLTLSQPPDTWVPELPDGDSHPVTLPVQEALEGLEITLGSFMKPPGILLPKLPEIEIKPKSLMLVYIPFKRRGNELSQPAFHLRINRSLLAYAKHL
ncbi:MAG: hypothetical protein MUO52_12375 [Desulfobacterales bacterium]|nr:hypothetical protein [Desulfobacterales bacterium]